MFDENLAKTDFPASLAERIKAACAEAFATTVKLIDSGSRAPAAVDARGCAVYLLGHVRWQHWDPLGRQCGFRGDARYIRDAFDRIAREVERETELGDIVQRLAFQFDIDISRRPEPATAGGRQRKLDDDEQAAIVAWLASNQPTRDAPGLEYLPLRTRHVQSRDRARWGYFG